MTATATLGSRLREARRERALTQAQLATAAQVTQGWVSDIETGRQEPTLPTLVRLADALSVSLDWLTGRE